MKGAMAMAAALALLGGWACGAAFAAPLDPDPALPLAPAPATESDTESLKNAIEILKVKLDVLEKKLQAIKDMESAKSQGAKNDYTVVLQSLDSMFSLLEDRLAHV